MPPILVPFVKYFDFRGRANRAEYWQYIGLQFGIGVVLGILRQGHGSYLISAIWSLATLIPSIAVGVRRYHDINRTGWWYALPTAVLTVGLTIAFAMSADSVANIVASMNDGASASPYAAWHEILVVGGAFLMAVCLYFLSLLVPFIMHLQPGTPGPNRFGPSPNGDGAERIASVFDAPEDEYAPQPSTQSAPEPYKPVFDFGPTPADRSPPPAAARGLPDVTVARPAPQAPRPMASPAANGPRPFGKRGL